MQRYLSLSPFLRVDKSERGGPLLSFGDFPFSAGNHKGAKGVSREGGGNDKIDPCVVRSAFAVLYPPTHCTEQMAAVGGGRGIKGKTPLLPLLLVRGTEFAENTNFIAPLLPSSSSSSFYSRPRCCCRPCTKGDRRERESPFACFCLVRRRKRRKGRKIRRLLFIPTL